MAQRIVDILGQLETKTQQVEAKVDSMSLGLHQASLVLVNTGDKVRGLCKKGEQYAMEGADKFLTMKEAWESLEVAVEELRKTNKTLASSAPVMRLIERHIKSCERLVGAVHEIADSVIDTVSEMIASTQTLATALQGTEAGLDEIEDRME